MPCPTSLEAAGDTRGRVGARAGRVPAAVAGPSGASVEEEEQGGTGAAARGEACLAFLQDRPAAASRAICRMRFLRFGATGTVLAVSSAPTTASANERGSEGARGENPWVASHGSEGALGGEAERGEEPRVAPRSSDGALWGEAEVPEVPKVPSAPIGTVEGEGRSSEAQLAV